MLPRIGFQFWFSSWHIAVRCLRTAHFRMTSLRAANVRGRVFTANCKVSMLLHFLETDVSRTWQFMVKYRLSCHSGKKTWFLCWYIVVIGSNQCCRSGSRSLLVRSGPLKWLWKFTERFSASESNWNPSCGQNPPELRFYICGCPTQKAVALKRLIFKRKKRFANLSLGLLQFSMVLF
jgi:hypothetical protein